MNITAYRLRTLRESMGLSQREVAERIGITRAAYNKARYQSPSTKA
ncbi:helix-turn-helix domain-containing protein [Selenomonas ruminantium]